jgi:hypothetical protein
MRVRRVWAVSLTALAATVLALTLACSRVTSLAALLRRAYLPVVRVPPAAPGPCSDDQPPLIGDQQVYQTPALAEPLARTPFRDPVFGTCVVRVTDRRADVAEGDSSAGLKNEYSRVQSFNADGSSMLVRGIEATWYVFSAVTLQPVGQLAFDGSVDPRWDATDPDLLYYTQEASLWAYRVSSAETRLVHDFRPDFAGQALAEVWTRHEGSPSMDTRYWGLMAENEDWEPIAFLVYDMRADAVIARRDLPEGAEIDNVTISPSGNYFLAWFDSYCERGQPGNDANPCGLMVYDRNLRNGRSLLRICGHADVAFDAQGREVLVYQDIDTDHISMLDLASGSVTELWAIDFDHTSLGLHFSGRAFQRPGWAVVSTYNGGHPTDYTWMDDQVFAVELKAGGRVARLAHTHSLYSEEVEKDYWAEPHASANSDLTRVLFTTNWGRSGTEEVEMYLIDLPPDWPDRLR